MASHRSKSLYAIKECSTCGRLYTKECCSIGSLKDKILVPVPDSSPRCARCGTPVDGPSCRGCAFLRRNSMKILLAIDPILEEFADELAHIAPIPSGIVEADFDPNDDTSSDDDDFEDIEYVSLEEVNDVEQEEKEFDLEDILQIQDVILREKLLNVSRLISNIESLKDNPIPIMDSDSSETSLSFSDNSLPEFESFSDHTEETRSGSTTTHANYSLPEFESFHFDPSFPRPPPEPPDVEILEPENNNFDVLNNDESFDPREGENVVFLNVEEDDSFTFTIRTFLPFVTYPEDYPDFEDSRALGFVHLFELHILSFI
ncbi:hypothetical protein Tco_0495648 [Tanacetum coccineum]